MNVRAYAAAFRTGARRTLADPTGALLHTAFLSLVLVVMSSLWRAAQEARPHLGGYSLNALVWYVLCAQAAVSGVRSRLIEELGQEIGSGGISTAMLRPVSVVGMRLAADLGDGCVRLTSVLVLVGGVTCLLVGAPPSWPDLLLAWPVAILGAATNLAAQTAFGGLAFWLRDAKAAWFLYQKLIFLPGGMLIPLELFPTGVAAVARTLPFAAMAYVPGRFGAGHADIGLVALQVVWFACALTLAIGVFALGERRLQVAGG